MTIKERFEHQVRLAAAGADKVPEGLSFGPPVQIWRQHRDGSETYETLPEWLAEAVLANIEPDVARAKIIRRSPELDYFLLADLAQLTAKMPAMEAA